MLALDEAAAPTPTTAPVRHAILDLDDDGDFDQNDVIAFTLDLIDPVTKLIEEPSAPNFDRFDLNGDGYTGGASHLMPFDLDRVGSTQYGASQLDDVTQMIEGKAIPFDETALNDLEILCYYAYSDLYDGDDAARMQALGLEHCAPITMTVTFPSTITPGVSETLHVSVGREGATGSEPVADIHIDLTPTNGTVSPPNGDTDAQGEFSAQAGLTAGTTFMEVWVRAFDQPGGNLLAEETVRATSTVQPPDSRCSLTIEVGPNPGKAAFQGVLSDQSNEGPVYVAGSVEYGKAHLEADWDYTGPWNFDGGAQARWTDVIEIIPDNPGDTVASMRHTLRITHASMVDNRTIPERSQGWFKIDASGHNPGGTTGFDSRNFGGTIETTVVDDVRERNASPLFSLGIGTRLSTFTGFGGDDIDAELQGFITVEWLGIDEIFDFGGNSIPFTYRTLCSAGGIVTTTSSTSTSTSSSTSTSTSTSTTTSTGMVTTTFTTSTLMGSITTTTSSSTTTTIFAVPVVPYTRYDATGPDGPIVMLDDQYASEVPDLGTVTLQLPPVTIDGLLPPDLFTSQTCYAHPGGVLDVCVDMQDRFGSKPLRVGNPLHVCIPELFPVVTVDAFKCYAATGTALDVAVTLGDDFQQQAVTIGKPELFCTPAGVDGDPINDAGRYLICYATTPIGAVGGQIQVENVLHGSPIQVDVGVATGLCVPAIAEIVSTCALCGDGVVDPDEACDDANVSDGDGCSAVCAFELACTCDTVPVPPPNDEGCLTLTGCGVSCTVCTGAGGVCGCQ